MKQIQIIEKFIAFSLNATPELFEEIFGKQKGIKLYHNDYLAVSGKNMPKFINSLEETDKKTILDFLDETFYSE